MSQASKHVEWCLRKAEREVEECKKLGKRPKHRGLIKSDTDIEEEVKAACLITMNWKSTY